MFLFSPSVLEACMWSCRERTYSETVSSSSGYRCTPSANSMRSCRVSEGTVCRAIFSRSRKSSSSCDACAAMSEGSLGGRSLESPRLYSVWTKSMAWSLGMLRWILRDSENMITVQEDRATFVCSTRIHNGEPAARTSCRARVRPDST